MVGYDPYGLVGAVRDAIIGYNATQDISGAVRDTLIALYNHHDISVAAGNTLIAINHTAGSIDVSTVINAYLNLPSF